MELWSAIGYVDRVRRGMSSVLGREESNPGQVAAAQLPWEQGVVEQLRRQQTHLFRDKKRCLEEFECQNMEQLYCSNETRKFYKKLSQSRNGFMPRADMYPDKDGGILTDERWVI